MISLDIALPKIPNIPFDFDFNIKGRPDIVWQPSSGPQTLAYESPADILGYGGSAGGGKTDLLLGLAATNHKQSVIFRRVFPNLRAIIERSREILKDGYNESLHRWILGNGKMVEFEACQYEKDREKQRGRPRDFYGFDEITEFTQSQFEFIIGWLRSTNEGQRCRVVMTFNPPMNSSGSWVVDYFKPWIAHLHPDNVVHPNPAKPGELRWYATIDGEETECKSGEPFYHNDEEIKPLSRTFIPAQLKDNPHLRDTNYRSVLQALPEPLRSQMLYGDFGTSVKDDPWQVIPTAWARLAQKRWGEKPNVPLSMVGVDVARGGKDFLTIAKRYDNWYDKIIKYPGVEIEDGPKAAGIVEKHLRKDQKGFTINVDLIGVGTSAYDSLKEMYDRVKPVNVAAGSDYRDESGRLKMRNVRAEMYWKMREALDPENGDNVQLPPGNEIVADLCAPKYKVTTAGVQIESKDELKKRLGRSPDTGDAVLLANYMQDMTLPRWV